MKKYVRVHGHFYQPPRENPWLEAVEMQDSAHPFHDWNERITAECYAPKARSRLLDGGNRIEQIVNNYSRISFNFGPTLLLWMQEKAPDILKALQDADKESQRRFSGRGSAMAQCYNHPNMPLSNARHPVCGLKEEDPVVALRMLELQRQANRGVDEAKGWTTHFAELGRVLGFSDALSTEASVRPQARTGGEFEKTAEPELATVS